MTEDKDALSPSMRDTRRTLGWKLMLQTARIAETQGEVGRAEELYSRALKLAHNRLGAEDPAVNEIVMEYAQFYQNRAKEFQEDRLDLVKLDEDERKMLAADLHDQVLNDLKHVLDQLEQYQNSNDKAAYSQIVNGVKQAAVSIREIMDNLCPLVIEHFGLAAAFEDCLERGAQRAAFQIRVANNVDGAGIDDKLTPVTKKVLYRLVQESITNICKHAKATHVELSINLENNKLVIKVTDDGVGLPAQPNTSSRGLLYMRLRANIIGAKVSWNPNSASGKGTVVEISVPVS